LFDVKEDGALTNMRPVGSIQDEIRQLVEMPDGSIWAEANYKGLWRLPPGYLAPGNEQKPGFYNKFGAPGNEAYIKLTFVEGSIIARTNGGSFRWVPEADSFAVWSLVDADPFPSEPTGYFFKKGDAWFMNDNGYLRLRDGIWRWEKGPFETMASFGTRWAVDESDSTLLFGGNRGMYRLFVKPERWEWHPPKPEFVYPRNQKMGRHPKFWKEDDVLTVPFGEPVSGFIAPGFAAPERSVRIRTKIEGLDTAWTAWSDNPYREFERLPAGAYRLMAQSASAFGMVSPVATRTVIVLPPWYQTRLAKAGMVLLVLLMMVLVGIWVRWYYLRRQVKLEQTIAERTTDLRAEKDRAEAINRQLAEQSELLRHAIEERRLLTSMVVHDLKNPISAVRGYAELIAEESFEKPGLSDLAERIQRVSSRMLTAISQLLQKDESEADLLSEPVNASDITLHVLGELMMLANRKNQTIRSRIEQECFIKMPADRISMVVENLVSNAIKYTHRGGDILLELGHAQDAKGRRCVSLKVTDNGLGLSQDDIKQLFKRYNTGTNEPTGGETSSGLGLYVIKQTVDAYGGTITVSSDGKGKGSKFEVRWL
jgi:signal transduction histidine kinase